MTEPLVATDVSFCYAPEEHVLQGVDVRASEGSLTCVTGPSGVGKSTLLYCLAGVLHASGTITVMGKRLTASPGQRATVRLEHTGFVFQRGELLPELSVLENVALPLRLRGSGRAEAEILARPALATLGIEHCAERRIEHISGGQAQRASVARALIARPSLVLADEPTASLDAASRESVIAALRGAAARGASVICATHDPWLIEHAEQVIELRAPTHALQPH